MAINGGKIEFGVSFRADNTGLNEVKQSLQELKNLTGEQVLKLNPNLHSLTDAEKSLKLVKEDIGNIEQVFKNAFDSTTGVTNINKLNKGFKQLDLQGIAGRFNAIGVQGQKAFSEIAKKALTSNIQFRETTNLLDRMAATFGNTVRWGISSKIINTFTGSIQQAWGYVKHLDTSLNDIRIVTDKSADEMDRFAVSANKAAKELGAATTDYTEAALIYYQQGLGDEEAQARAETTIKAANVTGQTGREVSEELTAVWNGYKVTAEETELYVDKLAAVAASTASDLEELSTGMSKVASAASNMGVNVDQLNGMLSTIISVTRQAPENAGTALKTIFARMEDLKIDGSDEDGVKLGEVSGTLDEVGVHILDTEGNLRDLGEVIEEVGNKWNDWTDAQKSAIAQALAGKRQYNNLLALFDNWDKYNTAVQTSENSVGTLQHQQDIYMQSTEAHLQQLETTWESFYQTLFDTDSINDLIDGLTSVIEKFTDFTKLIGGSKGLLLGLGTIALNVFGKQLTNTISDFVMRIKNAVNNTKALKAEIELTREYAEKFSSEQGHELSSEALDKIISLKTLTQSYYDVMSKEEIAAMNRLVQDTANVAILKETWEENTTAAQEYIKKLAEIQLQNKNNQIFKTKEEGSNYSKIQGLNGLGAGSEETDDIAKRSLESSTKSAEKLSEVYDKAQTTILEYYNVLDRGDEPTEENINAFNSMEEAVSALSKSLSNFMSNSALTEETQNEITQSVNETSDAIEVLLKTYELYEAEGLSIEDVEEAQLNVQVAFEKQEQVIKKATKAVKDLNKEHEKMFSGEAREKLDHYNDQLGLNEGKITSLTSEYNTREVVKFFTDAVKGATNLAFSIQQLTNLSNVWEDKNKSLGSKILSTITTLGMALPTLVSGFTNLSQTISNFNQVLNYNSLIQQGKINADKQAIIVSKLKEGATYREALAEAGLTVSEGLNTKALIKNTAATIKSTAAKIAHHAALLGIVALVGIAITVYGSYTNSLKRAAESSKELAEDQKKNVEQANNEKNSIDELAKSYESLAAQKEADNKFSADQEDQIYDLVKAYGDQSLIIKALAKDYEGLEEGIKRAQAAANEHLEQEVNTGKQKSEEALKDAILANAGITEDDIAGYDLSDLGGIFTHEDFRKDLQKLIGADEDVIDDWGHIGYDDLVKLLTTDSEKLHKFLDKYKDVGATEQIRELLNDNAELIDDINNYSNQANEIALNKIGYDLTQNTEEIQNIQDYVDKVNELAKAAFDKGEVETYQEGVDWAKEFLSGISDEFEQYSLETGVSDKIWTGIYGKSMNEYEKDYQFGDVTELRYKQLREDYDELNNKLHGLDEAQLSFVDSHQVLISSMLKQGEDVDEVFQHFKTDLNSVTKENHTIKISAIFDKGFDSKQVDEKIDELYANEDVSISGINSAAAFNSLDTGTQATILVQEEQEEIAAIQNISEEKKKALKEEEEYFNKLKEKEQELLDIEQNRHDLAVKNKIMLTNENESGFRQQFKSFTGSPADAADIADYNSAIQQMQEMYSKAEESGKDFSDVFDWDDIEVKNSDVLTALRKQYNKNFDGLENFISGLSEQDEAIQSSQTAIDNYETTIEAYDEYLEEIPETEVNWTEKLEHTSAAIAEVNKSLDDLQKGYQSLQSAVEEYEVNGSLSLDTVQSLISMNDQFLSSLTFENGQLSLKDQNLRSLVDTQLDYLKILATVRYQETLQAIADGDVTEATITATQAEAMYQDTLNNTSTASEAATAAINNLRDARAKAAAKDKEATDQATKAYLNSMALIDSLGKQDTSTLLGSSSSSSSKSSSKEEELEREEDIYHNINDELDDIETKLSRIQKFDEHSWGASAQEALKEENKLLDEQIAKYEEKAELQASDLANQKASLQAQGLSFSDSGNITNSEETLNSLYAEYNAMVAKYNSMTEAGKKIYKSTLEAKKESIEDIEEAIEKYESTYSEYQETLDTLLDKHYEAIENAVNQFNASIDIHLELSEAEREWNDFWKEVVEDVEDTDYTKNIEISLKNLSSLIGLGGDASASDVGELTKHLNNTTSEVWKQINSADTGGSESMFGDDTALSEETLTNYKEKLMSALRSAKEEVDNIAENYLGLFDKTKEMLDDQIDGWETIGDHLDHNVQMAKLLFGEKAYEEIGNQYEFIYENNLNKLQDQKLAVDTYLEQMNTAKAKMEGLDESSKEYKTYAEAYEKASENYKDAVSNLDKSLEDAIKDLQEQRQNELDKAMNKLDKALSGGMGLDNMEKEWKLVLDMQNYYLDNIERSIEMQSLKGEFSDVIESYSTQASIQKELLKFQDEEIAKLEEKNQLTQYDIDEVKARLEIKKAELALEEAQRNKSNMRLRRDSQGNYTYQYTANEDAIDDAENGLLTARKDWWELVKKRNQENSEKIMDINRQIYETEIEYQNALDAHDQATADAALARLELLEQQQEEVMGESAKNKKDIMDGTKEYFADVVSESDDSILKTWNTTVQKIQDKWYKDGEGNKDTVTGAIKTGIEEINTIEEKFKDKTKETLNAAGTSYDTFRGQKLDPTTISLKNMQTAHEDLELSIEDVNKDIEDSSKALDDACRAYEDLEKTATEAITAAQEAWKKLSETVIKAQAEMDKANQQNNSYNSGNNYTSDDTSGNAGVTAEYEVVDDPNGAKDTKGIREIGSTTYLEIVGDKISTTVNGYKVSGYKDYFKKKYDPDSLGKIQGLKSGGYTGDWNNESGRLAILHQKELVLNANDTANMLKMVEMVREVVAAGNSFSGIARNLASISASSALAQIGSGGVAAMNSVTSSMDNSSRNVTINADFTGVRSADEIYKALTELQNYNLQSLYA